MRLILTRHLILKNFFKIALFICCMLIFSFSHAQVYGSDDMTLITEVKNKIALNRTLSPLNIQISADDGIIIITGNVHSDHEASLLIQIAQSTPGVLDIDISNLSIKENIEPISDLLISSKIKGLLIRKKIFSLKQIHSMSIDVETNNGVVYLTGSIPTTYERDKIIEIAKTVHGVKAVDASIRVTRNDF